jgi:pyruvate dehydrogenase E2 component (dihydrolipoamide acetyltransferase)
MTAATFEIAMPRLSDSMEEGTILKWLVAAGAPVADGQELVEIETDKATMTYTAEGAGTLEILVEEGGTVAVGTPIAQLGEGGAGAPAPVTAPAPASVTGGTGNDAPASTRATPLARRASRLHGIDLGSLAGGSGPRGRIVKSDVLTAAGLKPGPAPAATGAPHRATTAAPVSTMPEGVEGAKGGKTELEPSRLQAVIARRMSEAKATVPHFQVQTEARVDAILSLRARLKQIAGDDPSPSVNDVIVKASALALRAHPKANGSYRDARFVLHDRINVGIAVAADGALLVPTIADADRLSLGEIGREARRLADRVRRGEMTPPELAGGTFTVSNLGMFGMTAITPVINVPQAAILGVGATREVLQRGPDGEVVDAAMMTLTLSCDHRILYGAEASEFLATIKQLLEEPLRML